MKPEIQDRIHTAVDNLKGASTWRPKDYLNFVNMLLAMPRSPATSPSLPHPAQVALTLFTLMKVSYQPGTRSTSPLPDSTQPDRIEEALLHTREPTVALFVDAPEHLSGVSLTLQSWSEEAALQGRPLFMHMAGSETRNPGCKRFPTVGT
ncbi:MAG: hypothetical protein PF795_05060, partial [Kiritimatiellae bacterium]|nr:hypothetical protein [Kiritimatiellia bacterium]